MEYLNYRLSQKGNEFVVSWSEVVEHVDPCERCQHSEDDSEDRCMDCQERDGDMSYDVYDESEKKFPDLESALRFIVPEIVIEVSGLDCQTVCDTWKRLEHRIAVLPGKEVVVVDGDPNHFDRHCFSSELSPDAEPW